jgi:hypothetical protein
VSALKLIPPPEGESFNDRVRSENEPCSLCHIWPSFGETWVCGDCLGDLASCLSADDLVEIGLIREAPAPPPLPPLVPAPVLVPYGQRHPHLVDFAVRLVRAGVTDEHCLVAHLRVQFEMFCALEPAPRPGAFEALARWAVRSRMADRERRFAERLRAVESLGDDWWARGPEDADDGC